MTTAATVSHEHCWPSLGWPNRRRKPAGFTAVLLVLAGLTSMGSPADAQQAVQLVTPYPAILVESGKNVNLPVRVVTPSPRRVDLAVIEAPPGWQATLTGGGYTINGVFGDPAAPPTVQLTVKVPPGVGQGTYRVVVRGSAAGGQDILPIDLTVGQVTQGAVTLTSEFPSQRGGSDRTFNYKLTLVNNTPEATTFNLSGRGPRGWEVSVHPTNETQAASVNVEGGQSAEITADVDPPDEVTAKKYSVTVRAEAPGKSAETTLETEITGSARLSVTTAEERLNTDAVAGRATEVDIMVRNEGTAPVRAVKLSSSPPTGWEVSFRPETIAEIAPRRSGRAVAVITPSGDAVAGDYNLEVTATGATGGSSDASIRVTVKTSPLFGFLGLVVIGAAIYFLLRVFTQYGRR